MKWPPVNRCGSPVLGPNVIRPLWIKAIKNLLCESLVPEYPTIPTGLPHKANHLPMYIGHGTTAPRRICWLKICQYISAYHQLTPSFTNATSSRFPLRAGHGPRLAALIRFKAAPLVAWSSYDSLQYLSFPDILLPSQETGNSGQRSSQRYCI